MAVVFDYSRAGRPVSLRPGGFSQLGRALTGALMVAALAIAATLPLAAQYAGKVPEQNKAGGPQLRAVAVLEWTGDPGHPKASRLVPITLWDGQELQDASIYMAQPEPLALQSDVEYKLKENGKTIGYFDVTRAGQSQGAWVGFGSWKPLAPPKPAEPAKQVADFAEDDDSGRPILHRARHADDSSTKTGTSAPPPDPDRPRLKEAPKKSKSAGNPQNDVAYSQAIANVPDPDRPRLFHGKAPDSGPPVPPTLAGLPPDMHQTIAVSEAGEHNDHIWTYSWASPDDGAKMKSEMEAAARKALMPTAPPATPEAEHRTARAHRRIRVAAPPPPIALEDEQFHVFQLTYGGPATMIFSAHTGSDAQEKFVTLIGQPDLYGNAMVLFKHVTSADNLDNDPAMRLINPVDAMGDNRGELLFELRGATQRQFALYRVMNGQAQKLFTSLPESVVMPAAPPES